MIDPDAVKIINADVMEGLRSLPDESVHCVVTSPPYWGLRDYGTATWEGGDPACDHKTARAGAGRADGVVDDRAQRSRDGVGSLGGDCRKCGAKRIDRQIGLEATPQEFVARMVEVFREVRRVLRKDGTCFVNLGDSYNAAGRVGHGSREGFKQNSNRASFTGADDVRPSCDNLKPKDLIGVPWRVALALQDDGWYLRQDIIWQKENPMPESVRDRCTKAHEYIFLLTKSERYAWDQEAIAEPVAHSTVERLLQPTIGQQHGSERVPGKTNGTMKAVGSLELRNRRSVWTIATQPFSEAHFATFPPELPEICIKAGCPKGGTVLDPFGGAGTTGLVAARLGRKAVLIELNPEYADMARKRIDNDAHGVPVKRPVAPTGAFSLFDEVAE